MVSGHPNIKLATSVIDFVFRVLGMEYLGRTDLVQVTDPPQAIDQTGEHRDLLPADDDYANAPALSPAQRVASPGAPSIPTVPAPAPMNGNGHGPEAEAIADLKVTTPSAAVRQDVPIAAAATGPTSAIDQQLGEMMGDAPFCDVCGHITVRNGACYKCLNCGNSLGCS